MNDDGYETDILGLSTDRTNRAFFHDKAPGFLGRLDHIVKESRGAFQYQIQSQPNQKLPRLALNVMGPNNGELFLFVESNGTLKILEQNKRNIQEVKCFRGRRAQAHIDAELRTILTGKGKLPDHASLPPEQRVDVVGLSPGEREHNSRLGYRSSNLYTFTR